MTWAEVRNGIPVYDHQPDGVVENERYKMLWEMNIQCDHVIEARRPDVVVDKENNKVIIVVITSPWDHRVYEKEDEKIEKYQDLKREIRDVDKIFNRQDLSVLWRL